MRCTIQPIAHTHTHTNQQQNISVPLEYNFSMPLGNRESSEKWCFYLHMLGPMCIVPISLISTWYGIGHNFGAVNASAYLFTMNIGRWIVIFGLLVIVANGSINSAKRQYVRYCWIDHTDNSEQFHAFFSCDDHGSQLDFFDTNATEFYSTNNVTYNRRSITSMSFRRCQMSRISFDIFATYPNVKVLNISSMELVQLQPNLPANADLEMLDASHNRLEAIENGQFSSVWQIVSVDLSFNKIRRIEETAFGTMFCKFLDLSHNAIQHLPRGALSGLTKFENLNLAHNLLRTIQANTFDQLESLWFVALAGNNIRVVTNQSNLVSLDLSFNEIRALDLPSVLPTVCLIKTINVTGNENITITGYSSDKYPNLTVFPVWPTISPAKTVTIVNTATWKFLQTSSALELCYWFIKYGLLFIENRERIFRIARTVSLLLYQLLLFRDWKKWLLRTLTIQPSPSVPVLHIH